MDANTIAVQWNVERGFALGDPFEECRKLQGWYRYPRNRSTRRNNDAENRVKEKEKEDMHGDPDPGVAISPRLKWQRNTLELWPLPPKFII